MISGNIHEKSNLDVQPEAMQMLYDYLLDAMTTTPPAKKLFGIL